MASTVSNNLLTRRGHTRHSSIPRATLGLHGSKGPPSPAGLRTKSSSQLSPLRLPKSKTTNDLSPSKIPKLSTPSNRTPKNVVTPQRKLMAPLGPPLPMSQTLPIFGTGPNTSPTKCQPKVGQGLSSHGKLEGIKGKQVALRDNKLTDEEIAWFQRQNEETIRARTSWRTTDEIPIPAAQRRAAIPEDFQQSTATIHQYVRRSSPGPLVSPTSSSGTLAYQSLSGSESSVSTYPTSPVSKASSLGIDNDPRSIYFPMPASYFLGRLSTLLDRKRQEDSFPSNDSTQRHTLQRSFSTASEAHETAEARRIASGVAELRAWCKTEEAFRSFNKFFDQYYALQRRKTAIARPAAGPFSPPATSSNTTIFKNPPSTPPAPAPKSNAKAVLRSSGGGGHKWNGSNTFGGLVKSKTMGSLRRLPSMKIMNAWSGKHNDNADMSTPKKPQTASKSARCAATKISHSTAQGVFGATGFAPQQATNGLRRRHTDVGKQQPVRIPHSTTMPISNPMPTEYLPLYASASSSTLLTQDPPRPLSPMTKTAMIPRTPKFVTPKQRMSDSQTLSGSSSRKSSGTAAAVAAAGTMMTKAFVEGLGGTLRRLTRKSFTTGSGNGSEGFGAPTTLKRRFGAEDGAGDIEERGWEDEYEWFGRSEKGLMGSGLDHERSGEMI